MQLGNNDSAGAVTAVVLAGGRSSRMGRDKARLPWADTSLLAHTLEAVRAEFDTILLSVRRPDAYADFGVPMVTDPVPDGGPLAGVVAALEAMTTPWLFAVACDMPFARPELWRELAAYAAADVEAVLPETAKGLEPLCAYYHRRCLIPFRKQLESGRVALVKAVREVRVVTVDVGEWDSAEGGAAFININTPDEFAAARASAGHAPLRS